MPYNPNLREEELNSNQPSGFLDFESNPSDEPFAPLGHLSNEANDVLAAGKALWRYYFEQPVNNVDASLYDIRKYFQGVNPKNGRINSSSNDEHYNNLRSQLSKALKNLANKISQKVFLYGFLK